ncbi:MAG: YHS domain-containing protein, partial [Pseudomonadota bacterium]|nr:YHS domain-containing protein [Pseudomonadota bacterium]
MHQHDIPTGAKSAPNSTAIDPVCGMTVDPRTAKHRGEHGGRTYYFCSSGCKTKFLAEPARYLAEAEPVVEPMPEGTVYTCPMHPEIRRIGAGACPICGMALEPDVVSAATPPNPELADMTKRLGIGLVLALPVLALDMGAYLTGLHRVVSPHASNWLQLLFATPVVWWAGWPFFVRGWRSLLSRHLNMFTLIALGTGVAWVYSVAATVAPGIFPPAFWAAEQS